jgi:hypothetical protein
MLLRTTALRAKGDVRVVTVIACGCQQSGDIHIRQEPPERRRTPLILIQQAHRVIRIRGNALSAASDKQGGAIQRNKPPWFRVEKG